MMPNPELPFHQRKDERSRRPKHRSPVQDFRRKIKPGPEVSPSVQPAAAEGTKTFPEDSKLPPATKEPESDVPTSPAGSEQSNKEVDEKTALRAKLQSALESLIAQRDAEVRARAGFEAEKPFLASELQSKTRVVASLAEENVRTGRQIQDVGVRLQNREIVRGRLEAEAAELAQFARSKDREIADAEARFVKKSVSVQTDPWHLPILRDPAHIKHLMLEYRFSPPDPR